MVNAKGNCKESLVEVAQYVFTGVSLMRIKCKYSLVVFKFKSYLNVMSG